MEKNIEQLRQEYVDSKAAQDEAYKKLQEYRNGLPVLKELESEHSKFYTARSEAEKALLMALTTTPIVDGMTIAKKERP